MFSQIRNAVEQLSQQQQSPTKHADGEVRAEADKQRSPTNSMDEGQRSFTAASPNQLAESAIVNFRRNLIASRLSSPHAPKSADKENGRAGRSIEERLRAQFTLGDASEFPSPDVSTLPTPGEVDPASIELPKSPEKELPALSLELALDPLGVQFSPGSSRSEIISPSASVQSSQSQNPPETIGALPTKSPDLSNETSGAQVLVSSYPTQSSPQKSAGELLLASDIPDQHPREDSVIQAPAPKLYLPEPSNSQAESSAATPRPLSPFHMDDREPDVEKVRQRLKLVEQRFADVSTSFKRLRAEKRAADQVLNGLTPVESITDVEGLRDYLKNLNLKEETSTEQIRKLSDQIQQHDIRLEELRDVHRLETMSQSEQIEMLRKQLSEAEALLKAGMEESTKHRTGMEQLRVDLEKAKAVAKEEEEKGTKAISLLKTVRAKLVKVEKEKDDASRELASSKDKDKDEKERDQLDRSRLELDLERSRLEREREVTALRNQFEKDLSGMKERLERENAARKAQFELEAITTKAAHSKEISLKTSRIASLESTIRGLSQEKDNLFDQLQLRQAEVESSQSHLDSVEAQSKEYKYQLREAEDRIGVLTEELSEANRRLANGHSLGLSSAEEVARLLSESEGKYEARIGDLRSKLRILEKERHDAEDEWSRNLHERGRELTRLRGIVAAKDREFADAARGKGELESRVSELATEAQKLRDQSEAERGVILGLQKDVRWLKEADTTVKQERDEARARLEGLEQQLEELQNHDATLKASNKALREELRKVQASAALLERQRNPVDLQARDHQPRGSLDEDSTASSRPTSPASVAPTKTDEDINLEYLRNVILQFLEHKEMRPNLVRVISIILHFTPQETRRLIAKV